MRIRTTRQAREIRAGIMLAHDPFLAQFIKYARPLTQRAYQRTKNRPPAGETGNIRAPHPGWLTTHENHEAHVIPIGDTIHHAEHPDCICIPHATLHNNQWTYVHTSLDGREHTEPDRKD